MTRIIADAGSFGFADRWKPIAKLFDAVITKTITPLPIKGHPNAVYEVRGGWINHVGLTNPGLDEYIHHIYKDDNINKIISIHADTLLEYVHMTDEINNLQCEAIELNMSCPNVENTITSPSDMSQLLHAVQRTSIRKIILKISPYQDYTGIMSAVSNTLQCVHVANTQPSMFMQNGVKLRGGFSSKYLKYAGLKATYDIRSMCPDIEIIAGGGVYSHKDIQDYVAMGADSVSVCSSVVWNPVRAWWLTRHRWGRMNG